MAKGKESEKGGILFILLPQESSFSQAFFFGNNFSLT